MSIEGSLDSVDIQDVVQLLNINQSTGILHIENTMLKGALYYFDGEIVNGNVEGMIGESAAYVLLSQNEGSFRFQMTPINVDQEIHKSIHDLVLEAARRKDTIGNIRTSIRHDNIVYLPLIDVRIPAFAKDFNKSELDIMENLDGQAEIQSIIDQHPKSAFEILYIIYELEQKGHIKRMDIYRLLEVDILKQLFGKANKVHVSPGLMDDWQSSSMTYSNVNTMEIRTQNRTYGQVEFLIKSQVPDGVVLLPKNLLAQFGVKTGDRVLVKPLLHPE